MHIVASAPHQGYGSHKKVRFQILIQICEKALTRRPPCLQFSGITMVPRSSTSHLMFPLWNIPPQTCGSLGLRSNSQGWFFKELTMQTKLQLLLPRKIAEIQTPSSKSQKWRWLQTNRFIWSNQIREGSLKNRSSIGIWIILTAKWIFSQRIPQVTP